MQPGNGIRLTVRRMNPKPSDDGGRASVAGVTVMVASSSMSRCEMAPPGPRLDGVGPRQASATFASAVSSSPCGGCHGKRHSAERPTPTRACSSTAASHHGKKPAARARTSASVASGSAVSRSHDRVTQPIGVTTPASPQGTGVPIGIDIR